MNFLAHLFLAGDDDGLRLGAMLGDFVRGRIENSTLPSEARRGVLLHRHIDQYIDSLDQVAHLREQFDSPFRRYSGIIIDLAFDHELAKRWDQYSSVTLEQFDLGVRQTLARHEGMLPEELKGFMSYADRRKLFARYRDESEILISLRGIGTRLSRANPLHRVAEIWPEVQPVISESFSGVFSTVRNDVADWLEKPENALVKTAA
jgi:acyl carrier protein phosphodiesterase